MDIERNVKQAIEDIDMFLKTGTYKFDPNSVVVRVVAPRASWKDFKSALGPWKEWSVLFGCAWSWFAIDVSVLSVFSRLDALVNYNTIQAGGFPFFNTSLYFLHINTYVISLGGVLWLRTQHGQIFRGYWFYIAADC
jgi:hypothetical protein